MEYHSSNVTSGTSDGGQVSRGPSGRIVVELDPELKGRLYVGLAEENTTFKKWLIRQIERYLSDRVQPRLFEPRPRSPSGDPEASR